MSEADPEAAYYQAVEECFVSLRGDPLFLSSADWTLVREWRKAGLPLRVVLRGIKDALDAHAHGWSRERKVGSLAYCAREVEAARERWERAIALGRDDGGDVAAALASFAESLEGASLPGAAGALAAEIARELRSWHGGGSLEAVTAWLAEREGRLAEALASAESEEERARLAAAVDAGLTLWQGRLPVRVLEQLRRESLVRRRLEAHGLPRLSLFHLEGGGAAGS